MEWLILAIVSWVVFLFLADWKELKTNVWGSIAAILLQYAVDSAGVRYGLYEIHKYFFYLGYSALFFVLGPILCIGALMPQYHPRRRWLKITNVLVLAGLYTLQEILLVQRGAVIYRRWSLDSSIIVNITAMIILSWIIMVVLKKDKERDQA